MDKLKQLEERINAFTIRERAMILLAVLGVIFFVWDMLFMQPLDVQQSRVTAQLETRRAEVAALNFRLRDMIDARHVDPDAENRERLARLRREIAELEQEILTATRQLIEPARMTDVLRTVIHQIGGLTLTSLEGLGVSPLLTAEDDRRETGTAGRADVVESRSNGDLAGAYRHGLRIRFRGSYLATLEYLRKLETLEWDFFWDDAEFEIRQYPEGETRITIYTLSLDRNWIRA